MIDTDAIRKWWSDAIGSHGINVDDVLNLCDEVDRLRAEFSDVLGDNIRLVRELDELRAYAGINKCRRSL